MMRTIGFRLTVPALACVGLGSGCLWSKFDELQDDTWVEAVGAPDSVASGRWGESFVEGIAGSAADGTTITVLARNGAALASLRYDAAGKRTVVPTTQPISDLAVFETNFAEQQLMIGSATTSEVALVVVTAADNDPRANTKVIVVDAATGALSGGPYEPPQAPNTLFGGKVSHGLAFGASDAEMWIARTDQVLRLDRAGAGTFLGCSLQGEEAFAISFGDVTGDAVADIVVASAPNVDLSVPENGRVWLLDPATVTGDGTQPALPLCGVLGELTGALPMGPGSRLLLADLGAGPRLVLSTLGEAGKVSILNFASGAPLIEAAYPVPDLGSLTIGNVDDSTLPPELIVGIPNIAAGGVSGAGQVKVLSPAGAELLTLSDATPETGAKYGKSVAAVPFGANRTILVVGDEGEASEAFVYFRTTLYDDVRTGR
ncbi:MAG: hypothetical protein KA190_10490 [Kofleriaceae bacterium]|nr:hypothetical protein [Kofleriaceae bacterium]